eukprot:g1578.t1
MILESRKCLTVRALTEIAGIDPKRIVIPNPDPEECAAILKANPELKWVINCDSHELIARLKGDPPDSLRLRQKLDANGFPGHFEFIWLDYCGTFSSKAGRRRQADVHCLVKQKLVSTRVPTVLAFTVSDRGGAELYRGEISDKMILFMKGTTGADLSWLCRYRNVRQRKSRKATKMRDAGSLTTAAFVIGSSCSKKEQCRAEAEKELSCEDASFEERYIAGTDWSPRLSFDTGKVQTTPLFRALRESALNGLVAAIREMKSTSSSSLHLLLEDACLLPISRSVCEKIDRNRALSLRVVLSDAQDAIVARSLRTSFGVARGNADVVFDTARIDDVIHYTTESRPFDVVWFGNPHLRRPFKARELRAASTWGALNELMQRKLLHREDSTLVVYVGIATSCELWKDSAIDWIVCGVRAIAKKHGYPIPRVSYVSRFSVKHPRAVVVFRICEDNASTLDVLRPSRAARTSSDKMPARWETWTRWDLSRSKIPTTTSLKYRKSATCITQATARLGITSVALHEPGLHYVRPALIARAGVARLVHLCGDDLAQRYEIISRIRSSATASKKILVHESLAPNSTGPLSTGALILLDDCGVVAWEKRWSSIVTRWLALRSEESRPRLLAGMVLHVSDVANRAFFARTYATAVVETYDVVRSEGRNFLFFALRV